MENLSGIYLVLIIGSILAFVFSFLYWCLFVYKKAKFYEVNNKLISTNCTLTNFLNFQGSVL